MRVSFLATGYGESRMQLGVIVCLRKRSDERRGMRAAFTLRCMCNGFCIRLCRPPVGETAMLTSCLRIAVLTLAPVRIIRRMTRAMEVSYLKTATQRTRRPRPFQNYLVHHTPCVYRG